MGIKWIGSDGKEIEAEEVEIESGNMFFVGDRVLLFSPYTEQLFVSEDEFDPPKFEILEVGYDEEDDVWRYRLDRGMRNEWYSEEWLSLPMATEFVKNGLPKRVDIDEIIGGQLRDLEIGRLLDIISNGTPEERKQAEEALTVLTEEDDGRRM
jgi:hypothetical protein